MKLLLDTCTFFWLCAEPSRLSPKAVAALQREEICVSMVTTLEVSTKWLAGKLVLPAPPRNWFKDQLEIWRATELPISSEDIFRASELPVVHRDPFDRLLVAQAINRGCVLVTPDEVIRKYPVSCLW